jgi:type IV pilus assembly protein PilA
MNCPHCGADTPTPVTFCPTCRKRVVAPSWRSAAAAPSRPGPPLVDAPARSTYGIPAEFIRPRAITLLAGLDLVTAFVLVAMGGLTIYASTLNAGDDRALLAAMAVAFILAGFGHFMAGLGLLGMKRWGRLAQIGIACLSLISIPVGTVMGALQLAWFFKPGVAALFSGRRPQDLPEDELAAALQASRETGIVTGAAVTGLVLVGCAGLGIGAAIAIPSLLVARVSANESAAIADLRTVVSAQEAYRSANGHYDRLECLTVPVACIPGYPSTGPVFLPGHFVSNVERSGYKFHLVPGPSPANLSVARSSASSMDRYAYLASPLQFRSTGRRVFCADDTGRVCAFTDLGASRVEDGRCNPECSELH